MPTSVAFSLAKEKLGPGPNNNTTNFQRVTASGQGGLFPHTLQCDRQLLCSPLPQAGSGKRTLEAAVFRTRPRRESVTLADHSYLANKALWDEYFFSSITPTTGVFTSGADRSSALDKAKRFFFEAANCLTVASLPISALCGNPTSTHSSPPVAGPPKQSWKLPPASWSKDNSTSTPLP